MDKEPRIPKVGEFVRSIGTLVKIDKVQPPPPKLIDEYIFEQIEARIEVRFNGEKLKDLSTFSDFYGVGTSVDSAIKDAKEYSERRGITKDSDLEVVVIKVVSQYRAKVSNVENYYDKEYHYFDAFSYGCKRDLPEDIETVVWSSKQ
jgi:hypothetical protein